MDVCLLLEFESNGWTSTESHPDQIQVFKFEAKNFHEDLVSHFIEGNGAFSRVVIDLLTLDYNQFCLCRGCIALV